MDPTHPTELSPAVVRSIRRALDPDVKNRILRDWAAHGQDTYRHLIKVRVSGVCFPIHGLTSFVSVRLLQEHRTHL
jgi:hypothetical protein